MEHENLTSSVDDIDYDDDVDFDEDEIFQLVSVIILSLLGIVGNAIIVFAYAKKKRYTSTDVLIVAQATTDFIATALAPSLILKTAFASLVNNGVCVISEIAENGSAFMSLFIMMAISVDRYLAVCRPFRRRLSNRHALIITLGCLIASIAIMSPRAIFIKSIETDIQLEVNCKIHHGRRMRLFVTALFPVTFVGALMVTSVLYSKIYMFLRKQAKVHVSLVNANNRAVGNGEGEGEGAGVQFRNDVCPTTSDPDQVTASSSMPNACDGDLLCGGAELATATQHHIELSTLTKMKMIPSAFKSNDTEEANLHRLQKGPNPCEQVITSADDTANTARTATTTAANSTSHCNFASHSTTSRIKWDDSNAYQAPSRESKLVKASSYRSTRPNSPASTRLHMSASNVVAIQNAVREADSTGRGDHMPDTVTMQNAVAATSAEAMRPKRRKENDMGRTTTKILLFITLFFFLTWIPQIFLTLFFQDNVDLLTSNHLALVIGGFSVLRSSNHVVNIFVYYYANRPFRNAVIVMFRNPCSIKTKIW